MRPSTLGRAVSFIPSTDLNVNLIPNNLTDTSRITWPSKLTHEINHHTLFAQRPQTLCLAVRDCVSWLPFIHSFVHSTSTCAKEIEVKDIFQNAYCSWSSLCSGVQVGTGIPSLQLSSVNVYASCFKWGGEVPFFKKVRWPNLILNILSHDMFNSVPSF